MMPRIVFSFPSNARCADRIAAVCDAPRGVLTVRRFPDGESYVRIESDVRGREAIIVCALDRPDEKTMALLFACDTLRALGAARITLIAPYLAYMRQDVRFHEGETLANRVYANLLSHAVDRVITVDPHLHRVHALGDIYSIPSSVVHAAPLVAQWIAANVESPVLIGPDSESDQWVRDVAAQTKAPFVVLEKTRRGDRAVEISAAHLDAYRTHTPVLVDDIISTGTTMRATLAQLAAAGMPRGVCIGVHAVFAGNAYEELRAVAGRVVTCDTIEHPSNTIMLSDAIAAAVANNSQ